MGIRARAPIVALCVALSLVASACGAATGIPEWARDEVDPQDARMLEREREANAAALETLIARTQARHDAAAAEVEAERLPDLPMEVVLPHENTHAQDRDPGTVLRSTLQSLHDDGPHAVLGAIVVAPSRTASSLVGFRVEDLNPDAEWLASSGIRRGDVIQQVNGRQIVMPDAFMQVWNALPTVDRVEVVLLRDGETVHVQWDVVEDEIAAESTDDPTSATETGTETGTLDSANGVDTNDGDDAAVTHR